MKMFARCGQKVALPVFTLCLMVFGFVPASHAQQSAAQRWDDVIDKFTAADKENPPKPGQILFIGSSSIRMWDLEKSFPDRRTINRGFGGSYVSDSLYFADRIVIPYAPRVIAMYAGDNDINAGKSPERVADDFKAFVTSVHRELPKTKIVFIAIKPSIKRWALVEKMRDANQRIRKFTEEDQRLSYVDIDTPMLGEDGKPKAELFKDDGLHLNDKGYEIWADAVRPHLK